MSTVTIALLGPRDKAFDEAALMDDADRAKRWDEREKVELEVDAYERLDSILQRAAEALDISAPWAPDSKFCPHALFRRVLRRRDRRQASADRRCPHPR